MNGFVFGFSLPQKISPHSIIHGIEELPHSRTLQGPPTWLSVGHSLNGRRVLP